MKKAWLNLQSRREISRQNFNQALGAGYSEFQKHFQKIMNKDKGYYIIDINEARKAGLMVLKSNT